MNFPSILPTGAAPLVHLVNLLKSRFPQHNRAQIFPHSPDWLSETKSMKILSKFKDKSITLFMYLWNTRLNFFSNLFFVLIYNVSRNLNVILVDLLTNGFGRKFEVQLKVIWWSVGGLWWIKGNVEGVFKRFPFECAYLDDVFQGRRWLFR